jgi:putative transposase
MRAWVQEWAKERVTIDWEKLLSPKGSKVLPRRWVVERTFISWLGQNRRLSKDYERLCETSEAFIHMVADPADGEASGAQMGPFRRSL